VARDGGGDDKYEKYMVALAGTLMMHVGVAFFHRGGIEIVFPSLHFLLFTWEKSQISLDWVAAVPLVSSPS
jgi:hypothetical protein